MAKKADNERHGLPSASGIERIVLCPGSPKLEASCPEGTPTEVSERGDRIHAALAKGSPDGLDEPETEVYHACMSIVNKVFEQSNVGMDGTLLKEERLWYKRGEKPRYSGKPDILLVSNSGTAIVLDYKTGWIEVEQASVNWQLRALAVLVWKNFAVDRVIVGVVQPPRYSTHEYDEPALRTLDSLISERLSLSEKPKAIRVAGASQCRYCRGKSLCPEYSAWVKPALRNVSVPMSPVAKWTDEQCVAFVEKKTEALKFIADCMDSIRDRLRERPIRGLKLKQARVTPAITDPQKAFAACGVPVESFLGAVKVSLPKLSDISASISGLSRAESRAVVIERLEAAGVIEWKVSDPQVALDETGMGSQNVSGQKD